MRMHFVGIDRQFKPYADLHHGVVQEGDFGWVVTYPNGYETWSLCVFCPKFRGCLTPVHREAADDKKHVWNWDGNVEEPTISPSIGCDQAPRCGRHMSIIKGNINEPT